MLPNVAEVIGEEMAALICDPRDTEPRGAIVKRAGGLMQTLVALDAAIERQVMPSGAVAASEGTKSS